MSFSKIFYFVAIVLLFALLLSVTFAGYETTLTDVLVILGIFAIAIYNKKAEK